jgi:hypothetical protein
MKALDLLYRLRLFAAPAGRAFVLWGVLFQKYDSGSSECEQHPEYNIASC